MACNVEIESYDLIPVASFLILKGKCRSCGSSLSPQYPVIELLTASLFLLAYLIVPPTASLWSIAAFVSLLVFLATLVVTVVYDIRHTLVPYSFITALALSAFLAPLSLSLGAQSFTPLIDALIGGVSLFAFFAILYAVTRGKGLGLGDAYVAGTIGLLLGFSRGIEAIMLGVWIGTIVYVSAYALSSLPPSMRSVLKIPRVSMYSELPLVPFLALGAVLAILTSLSPLLWSANLVTLLWPHF